MTRCALVNSEPSLPAAGLRVIAADGRVLGMVERVGNGALCLARESTADGRSHDIPLDWIDRIEPGAVHLTPSSTEEATLSALGTARGLREGTRRALPWLLAAFLAILLLALLLTL